MSDTNNLEKIEILLVDDRQENLLSLEAVLACPEYKFSKARSGDEALRYLLDHTPALILMDVQMPELNGFETVSILKRSERTREIPIIFVTAINKDQRFVHQGYDHGAVDYIYKPYDAHVLKAKVAVFADIRRQHGRISRLVSVQQAATQALAESGDDVPTLVSSVLKSICTSLGWDLGFFWRVDRLTNVLRCHSEWHDPAHDAPEFIEESFKKRFAPGVGIPGRVWADKKGLWIADLLLETSFPRLKIAAREKLRTLAGVPVFVQDDTMGVFEFYSRNTLPDDSALVKILGAIGSQVGQVLKRTAAFELVRVSEARKAAILETALDCIISMDQNGKIIEFNPAAETTFGYRRSEVIGKEMAEVIIPPALREAHRRGLKHYLASGDGPVMNRRIETIGMRSGGSEFPVELTVARVTAVEPPIFTGFLRDITAQKRIESNSMFLGEASAALSSSLNYEETFSAIAGLAVKSLADWCSIEMTDEEEQLHSVAVAQADGFQPESFSDWNSFSGATSVIRTGKSELHRDLGMKSVMIVPLTARTKILGAITFVSTKPARQYAKEDLVVAEELARRAAIAIDNAKLYRDAQEAIRTRDDFFSIASHELKTPITALKMGIYVARRGVNTTEGTVPPAEKLSKILDNSNRHVDRLANLVEDLLDVVKIRSGKLSFNLEALDLSGLVQEVAEQHADALAAARCSLELKIQPRVVGNWDHTRIEQVVVNLISNAIKYAPGKPVKIEVIGEAETAKFIVQDSGPGIPREQQTKIFERFERATASRNIAGLGLGLFIVKKIVDAHHGTIRIDSHEGKGSMFTVELPKKALAATVS